MLYVARSNKDEVACQKPEFLDLASELLSTSYLGQLLARRSFCHVRFKIKHRGLNWPCGDCAGLH